MKKWTFLAVLALVVAGTFLLGPIVHASPGGRNAYQGYFSGSYTGNSFWDNVFTSAIGSGVNTKAEFITEITNRLNSSGRDHLGGAFVINLMMGLNGSASDRTPSSTMINNWKARINSAGIDIHRGSIQWGNVSGSDIPGWNSAYATDINDEIFYPDSGSHDAIYFTNASGKIVFVLKTDCGNPLGDLPGLPPPNAVPTGNIAVTCNSNGTARISYTFYDNDGGGVGGNDTYAYTHIDTSSTHSSAYTGATLSGAGWTFHGPGNSASQTLSVAQSRGGYYAWLYAKDVGPAGDQFYHRVDGTGINCDQPPTGSLTLSCLADGSGKATFSFGDYDGNTTAVLTLNYAGAAPNGVFSYGTSGSYTRAVSATDANGTWSASLVIQDRGGNLDLTKTATHTDCSVTPPSYSPYFSVIGGDVAAGPGFGTGCKQGLNSNISGFNIDTNGSGPFYGAGTQLAALAMGDLSSFATAQNANGTSSGPPLPSGLAFANDSASASGTTYGGSFNKSGWCVPDYVGNAAGDTTNKPLPGPVSPISLNGLASGTYQWGDDSTPSSLQINASQLANSQRLTLIVYGDVFINGDIKYQAYANQASIPQLRLLVAGNIYVFNQSSAVGVTELHGFYDAQVASDGTGGTIFTCATAMGVTSKDYATCNRPLTIYGGVAADTVELDRSYGNIRAAAGTVVAPAEQIVYTPELWLGNLNTPLNGKERYQAFTSLPPLL